MTKHSPSDYITVTLSTKQVEALIVLTDRLAGSPAVDFLTDDQCRHLDGARSELKASLRDADTRRTERQEREYGTPAR